VISRIPEAGECTVEIVAICVPIGLSVCTGRHCARKVGCAASGSREDGIMELEMGD